MKVILIEDVKSLGKKGGVSVEEGIRQLKNTIDKMIKEGDIEV